MTQLSPLAQELLDDCRAGTALSSEEREFLWKRIEARMAARPPARHRIKTVVLAAAAIGVVLGSASFLLRAWVSGDRSIRAERTSESREEHPTPVGSSRQKATIQTTIRVPARPHDWRESVFTGTGLRVRARDTLVFSATGRWDVGLGPIGPEGSSDSCECVVLEETLRGLNVGKLGAVIGRIGSGTPFYVGERLELTASDEGELFLTSNDNTGPCDGSRRNSCYRDNSGFMQVRVEIRR